jgi:sugar transferase (PEP-CTERM system associated)
MLKPPPQRGVIFNSKLKANVLVFDLLVLIVAVALAYGLRLEKDFSESMAVVLGSIGFWFIALVHLVVLYVFGSYDLDRVEKYSSIALRTLVASLASIVLVVIVNFIVGKERAGIFGRGVLIGGVVAALSIELLIRFWLWKLVEAGRKSLHWLFVGTAEMATKFVADLSKNYFSGQMVLVLDRTVNFDGQKNVRVIGTWEQLPDLLSHSWVQVIVGVENENRMKELGPILMDARFAGHKIHDLIQFYETQWKKVPLFNLNHSWFVLSDGFGLVQNPVGLRIKRLIDIALSGGLLFFAWPFMVLTAIAVRLESPGDALFSQVRTGKDGRSFVIYKFRSMRNDAEKDGAKWAVQNDARVTRVGRFIRLTRLDELPQLFNVFKGEMSFIGPRPERPEFNVNLETEIPFYNLRHLVNPGITGWAQVLYPYGASIDDSREKLQYELYYIKNYSLFMDLQIVLKTIGVVVMGRGR